MHNIETCNSNILNQWQLATRVVNPSDEAVRKKNHYILIHGQPFHRADLHPVVLNRWLVGYYRDVWRHTHFYFTNKTNQ